MRIGMFSDAYLPDINGVVSSIATLKTSLEKMGHTVFVISNHKGTHIEYDEEQRILRLPGIEIKKMYGYKISSPIQFAGEDYVERMNLDVIHVHTELGVGFFARSIAKKLHIPVVYTYHTMYEDYTHYVNPGNFEKIDKYTKKVIRFLSREAGNGPQAVIVPSNKTKKALQSYGVHTPIYVVPTGIDFSDFEVTNLDMKKIQGIRNDLSLPEDANIVVFVGRIAKEKCIEMPIEAIKLLESEPSIHLVVVGGGTDEKFYHNLVDSLHIGNRVHFLGKIPKEEIPYYYAAFDCFVSASVSETQGMTYLEALATGLPVFGRRDEVLDDLVEEDKSGYYFDDAAELAEKLRQYFKKPEQDRQRMKPFCVSKTKAYGTELFGRKVLAVYDQAIDDYHSAYTIEKITPLNYGFVQLVLSCSAEEDNLKIKIPDNDYFDMKLGINTMLDQYLIRDYLLLQNFYEALIKCKARVSMNDYTAREIYDYGVNKLNLEDAESMAVVDILEDSGLIDDREYALEKADVWHSYGQNKLQIKKKLQKAGVPLEFIEEALEQLSEGKEETNALKSAQMYAHSIRMQSSKLMRKTILNKLIRKGYSVEIARKVSESVEIEQNDEEALMMAMKKAERLYASEMDKRKKIDKIRLYCMRKGFSQLQISQALEDGNFYD
ncbi:MAG: RecX family transcriptional regulator [Erysipelotrichaceae bacterium]|nr:RecX family transcriptional regulator [Erysipelotrichaceae bacterium]